MSQSIVLFDGACNLCHRGVKFIIAHDRAGRFGFASLQSAWAARLLGERGVSGPLPDSMILIDASGVHVRSEAAVRIAGMLDFPWSVLAVLRWMPRLMRDWLYDRVAGSRYRLFGKRETCMMPGPGVAARFLDAHEGAAKVSDG